MPFLRIQTNQAIPEAQRSTLLRQASATLAHLLGKPEGYVMVVLEHNPDMLFAGEPTPLAYLELKSIGLPAARTRELSTALCALLQTNLAIPPARTYIEFTDAPRQFWGWNGATF